MPASTVTTPVASSAARMRFSAPMSTSTPSVHAASVNECPDPATFTVRPSVAACVTTAASSSSLRGRSIRAGAQRCSPAQFVHSSATCVTLRNRGYCPAPSATASPAASIFAGSEAQWASASGGVSRR